MTTLPLDKIHTDGGTQPRAAIDWTAVEDYADAMRAGAKFPPVVVFYDGSDYWLADGFHRWNATFAAERDEVECDVHQGTQQDAQWYSFAANKANGLRRTNEDKQRAVKAALAHPGGAGKSDRDIAKHVGVAPITVGEWRKKLQPDATIRNVQSARTGSDGRTINTANIGRKPAIQLAADAVGVSVADVRRAQMVQKADRKLCEQVCAGEITLEAAFQKVQLVENRNDASPGESNYDRMLRAVMECHDHLFDDIEALPDPAARLQAYIMVAQNEAPEAQLAAIRLRADRIAMRLAKGRPA